MFHKLICNASFCIEDENLIYRKKQVIYCYWDGLNDKTIPNLFV